MFKIYSVGFTCWDGVFSVIKSFWSYEEAEGFLNKIRDRYKHRLEIQIFRKNRWL